MAVGVPELTLIKPNFAEVVAVPPIRRSTVELAGYKEPEFYLQKFPAETAGSVQEGLALAPLVVKT